MKITTYLDAIEDKKVWDILRVFVSGRPFVTGRQMSYLLSLNHKTATRYLERMVKNALLSRQKVGKAYIYSIKDNYFTREVILPFLRREKRLYGDIKALILKTFSPYCIGIALIGAYAHQTETASSPFEVCFFMTEDESPFRQVLKRTQDELMRNYDLELEAYLISVRNAQPSIIGEIPDLEEAADWLYGDKESVLMAFQKPHSALTF